MRKSKKYVDTFFSVDVIERARQKIEDLGLNVTARSRQHYSAEFDGSHWIFDSREELYAEYRKKPEVAQIDISTYNGFSFRVIWHLDDTEVFVEASDRDKIESVFRVFEDASASSKITPRPKPAPVIFIGHGGSSQWRDLKDHLHEKHRYDIEAYEIGARAGHTIRDILESMLHRSTLALLVLTAEDEHEDGTKHARENVIHELGLFQGKLGFSRAIILLEDGASEFSNIHGIHQIRFSSKNIRETFGDVLATLKRETLGSPSSTAPRSPR
jgi:predicted nucleotide-binding protein